jgi:hypothetical protein
MTHCNSDCIFENICGPFEKLTELCNWENDNYEDFLMDCDCDDCEGDCWCEMAEARYTETYWNMDEKEYE